jgi:GNAT superfamily N-acetyltransferase
MADLAVRPVSSDSDLQAFLRMPWTVYKDDPVWAAPLWSEHVKFFDPAKNVELQHIDHQKFVAWRGDTPVGTIIAFVNQAYNDFQGENAGWFGQFEILNDQEVAHALLKTAEDWVRAKGVNKLMGPATYSTNSEIGLQISGFDMAHTIQSPHARAYVQPLLESYGGFTKAMDLWYWRFDANVWGGKKADKLPEKIVRVAQKIQKRKNFVVRTVNMKDFNNEVDRVKVIYNQAWAKNWGFVPMSDEEIDSLAKGLKDMIDPAMGLFVELDGEPIAFAMPLPDIYQPMRLAHLKPGEPEIWQLLRLIWYWKVLRRVTGIRAWALGVLEEHRASGVDALLYYELLKRGLPRGYVDAEMSWILETNDKMNAIIRMMGAEIYKIFRVYEKPLK